MVSKGVGVEVMFRYKINVDAKEWDLFLENHPQGNLLQSSDWSKIKDTWGNGESWLL
ncbi:peptidoglycan branched peptide synthesis protein, alanine adding enzyme [Streptococcus mitis 13/39]|uniref:Peptidoglycan branched peptide synthesis protein, alanine adding enzyme n=1 Tax=Streptococcus mitis 13/39 TaxID=1239793 RepID=R0P434_STRMT|nr:peptidoglycan branched peptide synthesis protein, alanine adding enzyme [Streptococcus mitis 13/39]